MNHLSIRIEGGLLSPDFLETIHEAVGQKPADFGLEARDSLVDEVSAIWGDVLTYWRAFQRRKARSNESLTTITREQWLLPLLEALGYTLTYQRSAVEQDGRSYLISHRASRDESGPPVHLVAYDQPLGDRPPSGRGTLSPHALVQDYLNRTDDHLWGIVSNGRLLRLLRDSTYFTRPAYIEFDLEGMFNGERLDEFFLLYRLAHRSRLPRPNERPADCLLEQYYQRGLEQGGRIRDGLRQAVADAIVNLGNGFLRHPRNESLRRRLQTGELTPEAYYQQLLYLIYRLLFLMVAEERNLLEVDGRAAAYYRAYFSISRLRALADTPLSAPERFDDLYLGLRTLFVAFHNETLATQLGVPPLNGELFSSDNAPDLDAAYLNNRDLLQAIRLLSYFTPSDEKVRRRVNYAALDVEELGSVYESLLDEQPVIDGLPGSRGDGEQGRGDASFAPATHHPLTFAFVSGTARKTTGSYYTPRELVNEVIKSALVPVIEARLAEANLQSPISSRQSPAAPNPQAKALLALRVCDPACGSGHFLLAAARRIGYELAKVRANGDEPSPEATRAATREAITHCIYGVDKNPLAVDLCKVALWIEGHSRGKPLTFLDYRIRCGDSLVGVLDLAVLDEGIPDAAFEPVSGDDKKTATGVKKQNKEERKGQMSLFDQLGSTAVAPDAAEWEAFTQMPEDTPAQINAKRARYHELLGRGERARTAANLWTAAFFSQLTPENLPNVPTSDTLRRWLHGQPVSAQVIGAANALAEAGRFFHWPLEFPQVFATPVIPTSPRGGIPTAQEERDSSEDTSVASAQALGMTGGKSGVIPTSPRGGILMAQEERDSSPKTARNDMGSGGGFDVVLGNPPWERIKLQEQEFFATRDAEIATAANKAARERLIKRLPQTNPRLARAFVQAKHAAEAASKFLRGSGRFPLTARGDINTYALFAELVRHVQSATGRVGIIVPSGIATDDTTKYYFQDIMDSAALVSLYDFENRNAIFPGVHRSYKFCLLTLTGADRPAQEGAQFVFFALDVADLRDEERRFTLSAAEIALLNPNTRTCPIFRSKRDAELTKGIYRRVPVLIREGVGSGGVRSGEENPWGISFLRMFDMSNDSGLFRTREQLEGEGWRLAGNRFVKEGSGELEGGSRESASTPHSLLATRYLPLYEAKMLHQFDHRWATYEGLETRDMTPAEKNDPARFVLPRYWVQEEEVNGRLPTTPNWLIGFRDIARSTDERTAIFSLLPKTAVGHTAPLIFLQTLGADGGSLLLTGFDSLVFDYATRQKVGGTHMTYGYLKQLPVLPPQTYRQPCLWGIGSKELAIGNRGEAPTPHSPRPTPYSLTAFLLPRVLELTYTAYDLRPFAQDCGYHGPPFRWHEERRFLLRCELDAAYFHLYGIERDDVAYIMDTFPIVHRKDEAAHGEYRTKRVILEMYDEMAAAMQRSRGAEEQRSGYQTRLDPPPGHPDAAHPWDEAYLGPALPREAWWQAVAEQGSGGAGRKAFIARRSR